MSKLVGHNMISGETECGVDDAIRAFARFDRVSPYRGGCGVAGAIQTLADYCYFEKHALVKTWRYVCVYPINEGAFDIQKLVIAQAL